MKIVIKIGGHAAENREGRRRLARQIAALSRSGHHVAIVHGGGKMLTETLARLGMATEFHHGLRVTDAATRDVALMVLAGMVNKTWVAELEAQGQAALGICGGDGRLVVARKLTPSKHGPAKDLGFVGRPSRVRPALLEMAFRQGMVPVIASLGLSARGVYLNINADDLAAALATSLRADRLLYLTESGGVWDAERRLLRVVKVGEIQRLIRQGVVRDGMIPKLRSCARSLRSGVGEIDIMPPDAPSVLVRAVERGESLGTRIVKTA